MEVAVIDWKSLDTRFVRDDLYEDINAPQWVDFSAPDEAVDDESWFCRPDCKHPRRFEDYFSNKTPESTKKPSILSEMPPLNERNNRDATLKKRGILQPMKSPAKELKYKRVTEDGENHNPNYLTPPKNKAKILKGVVKSSAEKSEFDENNCRKEQRRSLRRTLSAKNLFAGGDILSRVTEFCNELKKLATRARERGSLLEENMIKDNLGDDFGNLDMKEKERKPLLQVSIEKNVTPLKTKSQEKQIRKKRSDDAENTPVTINSMSILKEQSMLQIRTCPPTPQCFSANHGTSSKAARSPGTPLQPFKSKTLRGGILQELQQRNVIGDKMSQAENQSLVSTAAEKEAKTLDVFWFLKPCALSS